jgi:hypothetical protein
VPGVCRLLGTSSAASLFRDAFVPVASSSDRDRLIA